VRSAKPRTKAYKLTDEKGLYLIVKPTGGKLWLYKYGMGGKERSLSIGPYPEITLAIARDRRVDARRLLSEGIDPPRSTNSSGPNKPPSMLAAASSTSPKLRSRTMSRTR